MQLHSGTVVKILLFLLIEFVGSGQMKVQTGSGSVLQRVNAKVRSSQRCGSTAKVSSVPLPDLPGFCFDFPTGQTRAAPWLSRWTDPGPGLMRGRTRSTSWSAVAWNLASGARAASCSRSTSARLCCTNRSVSAPSPPCVIA
jgi:hypothetical protein